MYLFSLSPSFSLTIFLAKPSRTPPPDMKPIDDASASLEDNRPGICLVAGVSNGTTSVSVAGQTEYQEINGATETVKDDSGFVSTGWSGNLDNSYAAITALKVKLESKGTFARFKRLRTTYVYAEIDYTPAGYGNNVLGVASGDIAEVNDVATANIAKINGV